LAGSDGPDSDGDVAASCAREAVAGWLTRKGVLAYRLHKPSGQARVIIDGRHVYLGPYGSEESKAEYERLVRKLLTDRTAAELEARVQVSTDLTIAALIASYLAFAKTDYVKNGRETQEFVHICSALRPIREQHGYELVTGFGPLKLKAIRRQWIEAGMVRSQINKRVGRVRRCFAWGVEEELVPVQILEALRAIKGLRQGRCEAREGRKVLPVPDAFRRRPPAVRQSPGLDQDRAATADRDAAG
jgi:hypothetical protein